MGETRKSRKGLKGAEQGGSWASPLARERGGTHFTFFRCVLRNDGEPSVMQRKTVVEARHTLLTITSCCSFAQHIAGL